MAFRRTVAPGTLPVTVSMLRDHAKLDTSEPDTLLTLYLGAVVDHVERVCGISMLPQTWVATLDEFPDGAIELSRPPVASITSLKYYDANDVQQTLSNTLYSLDAYTQPGYVLPVLGSSWPLTSGRANAVEVTFVTGYADAASVPDSLKAYIYVRAASAVKSRELDGGDLKPNPWIDAMLDPFKVSWGA